MKSKSNNACIIQATVYVFRAIGESWVYTFMVKANEKQLPLPTQAFYDFSNVIDISYRNVWSLMTHVTLISNIEKNPKFKNLGSWYIVCRMVCCCHDAIQRHPSNHFSSKTYIAAQAKKESRIAIAHTLKVDMNDVNEYNNDDDDDNWDEDKKRTIDLFMC